MIFTNYGEHSEHAKKRQTTLPNSNRQSGFQDSDGNPAYALSSFLTVNPGRDLMASACSWALKSLPPARGFDDARRDLIKGNGMRRTGKSFDIASQRKFSFLQPFSRRHRFDFGYPKKNSLAVSGIYGDTRLDSFSSLFILPNSSL